MKAWVFVEGESDRLGLRSLWSDWCDRLKGRGAGIAIIPLHNKANYLKKFGERSAQKLVDNDEDVVVGLPDLHPIISSGDKRIIHRNGEDLKKLQLDAVKLALSETHQLKKKDLENATNRVFASLLKHDFEMLLLAAQDELRQVIGTRDKLGDWRTPVEDQNLGNPPKRVVEKLFRTKSNRNRSYLATKDAPAVLRRVKELGSILRTPSGQWTCPEFVAMLKWLGNKLGEPCCTLE